MKKIFLIGLFDILLMFNIIGLANATTIWNSNWIYFEEQSSPNYTDPLNQDYITSNVTLTRGDWYTLINISAGDTIGGKSIPTGTEWAWGTTNNLSEATFDTFVNWSDDWANHDILNESVIIHLIDDDIYIDIKFTSWSLDEFAYIRSSDAVPEPATILLFGAGLIGVASLSRKKIFKKNDRI